MEAGGDGPHVVPQPIPPVPLLMELVPDIIGDHNEAEGENQEQMLVPATINEDEGDLHGVPVHPYVAIDIALRMLEQAHSRQQRAGSDAEVNVGVNQHVGLEEEDPLIERWPQGEEIEGLRGQQEDEEEDDSGIESFQWWDEFADSDNYESDDYESEDELILIPCHQLIILEGIPL